MTTIPMRTLPSWLQEVRRSLSVRSQIVLSGNIHDRFVVPSATDYSIMKLEECVWRVLEQEGYEGVLRYDRVDGLSVYPQTADSVDRICDLLELKRPDSNFDLRKHTYYVPQALENLAPLMQRIVFAERRLTALIDFASRLTSRPADLSPNEHDFFAACEKLAYTAVPRRLGGGAHNLFNPIIWLVHHENDLPSWLRTK